MKSVLTQLHMDHPPYILGVKFSHPAKLSLQMMMMVLMSILSFSWGALSICCRYADG